MALVLNEEEMMVRDAAAEFLAGNAGPDVVRELRDGGNSQGFTDATWSQMVELGWPGILVPEEHGGLGFTHAAMGQVMEQLGRTLAASPLFASGVVGASLLASAGSDQQKRELLPRIAGGELKVALAIDETARHNPTGTGLSAQESEGNYTLNGEKRFVVDGVIADYFVVLARTDELSLFLVPADAEGVTVDSVSMVDSRSVANVTFSNVAVTGNGVIGEIDKGMNALQPVLDIANVHLSAELLGISIECFDRTLHYLKDRTQFGIAIGTFQALQHRAATLWMEIELCKSIVLKALRALDENSSDSSILASQAKAKTCKIAELATNEGIQLHGGIGMTDEYDMGFFLKRARVAQMLYGDRRFHLDRAAMLAGY